MLPWLSFLYVLSQSGFYATALQTHVPSHVNNLRMQEGCPDPVASEVLYHVSTHESRGACYELDANVSSHPPPIA